MKQIIQNFKTGELKVDDVPSPALKAGGILVQNFYSVISAGTEKATINVAQASLLGKAKQKPEQVKQVLDTIKKEGLLSTYQKVMNKLSTPKALGYSSSGKVIAVAPDVTDFSIGDWVACSGQDYASHAEIVFVPKNLATKVPPNVAIEDAAFTTMGAIALQGVRLCKTEIGCKVAVIGLGLLGNMACQILKSAGVDVMAIDVNAIALNEINALGIDITAQIGSDDIIKKAENFTNGYGCDAVLIAAGTSSNHPIELAGIICRKKGRVVVTGAVRMDVPRENYFKKEIELVISSSYGPGRYDSSYEENGLDYPYAYVRFTENRNFQTILDLIGKKSLNVKSLISHRFAIDEAVTAYDIITGKKKENFKGIVLNYSQNERLENQQTIICNTESKSRFSVSFIGAGSYAQSYLLPAVNESKSFGFETVCTSNGINAKNIAQKYRFRKATSSADELIADKETDIVFIATRHNTHAEFAVKAIEAGKHVFIEKPLAMSREELALIQSTYLSQEKKSHLMVGFNRRYSELSEILIKQVKNNQEPILLNYRINAGFIPKDHWIQDSTLGGGRIIGEVCHFIDYAKFIIQSKVKSVYAKSLISNNSQITNEDNLAIILAYENGSMALITYLANGDKSVSKERIEVTSENKYYILDNFQNLAIYTNGKLTNHKKNDKGQKRCAAKFLETIKQSESPLIPFEDLYESTLISFDVLESLKLGMEIRY